MFGFDSKEKDRTSAQGIINVMHNYYSLAKKKFPNKKEIFYLALTWAIYAKKHHPVQYKNDQIVPLIMPGSSDTLLFSFLKPPGSVDALAYYMIHKEKLSVSKEYEPKYNEIMAQLEITEEQVNAETERMVVYLTEQMEKIQNISENDF